jgi:ribonuclease P protein component
MGMMQEMQKSECRMQNEDSDPRLPTFGLRSAFPRTHRLSGKLAFAAVYDAKRKVSRGALTMYSLPNALGHPRLGISISRRVGTSPRRNRIKRLIREAFRFHQHDLKTGYDLVIGVRPHAPMNLGQYQELVSKLMSKSHGAWISQAGIEPQSDPHQNT